MNAAPVPRPLRAINTAMAARTLRAAARRLAQARLDLRVEGAEHVPARGPVMLAARHYHHLYDGVALLAVLPRPLHILVALDWVEGRLWRRLMEWATRTARWPVVLRGASPRGAFAACEIGRYRRRGAVDSVALLAEGAALLVFPEGYPNIDPGFTPKPTSEAFLPFRGGFATILAAAERRLGRRVPIVPTGLAYVPGDRWQVTVRFGPPMSLPHGRDRTAFIAAVQGQVKALSS